MLKFSNSEISDLTKLAKNKLKSVFGYSKFRANQQDIIETVLAGENCVVIMPTGSGKSLCYQIPALVFEGLSVVISPLISLMKNQVTQLRELGVEAEVLNSSLTGQQYSDVHHKVRSGKTKILYLAPETLALPVTRQLLQSVKVEFLAVDEAHCISEWGHDFRPEYRQIAAIRKEMGNIPTIALTATAAPRVQDDIAHNLGLESHQLFKTSFNRENLFLEVMPKSDPFKQTTEFLDKFPQESAIIYCFSRKGVDELSKKLNDAGYSSLPYHAGLDNETRKKNQEQFIKDDVQIIVATVAFGMGIDKPNIRSVIHYDLPKDIESYYQQIGRAGRDGSDAYCLLLFGYQDVAKLKFLFQNKVGQELKNAYRHLESMLNFSEAEDCRRIILLNYFGEDYQIENCKTCDNCVKEKQAKNDLTLHVQKFLSCIYRTDQFFGSNHIIKILRGSSDKKIMERRHDQISTYGIGKELSVKQWLHLYRQMQRAKLITVDPQYGSMKLTESGIAVLKNKDKFYGNLIEEKSKIKKRKVDLDYDVELFELLRTKRKELADAKGIPPYTIFHDKTLAEICSVYPKTPDEMLDISGIGKAKLEKYGKVLFDIILPYCLKKGI